MFDKSSYENYQLGMTFGKRRHMSWIFMQLGIILAIAAGLLAVDLLRPPAEQFSSKVLLAAIDFHSEHLSPILNRTGTKCKFEPTCSEYAREAIIKHGAFRGSILAVKRLGRCTPFGKGGGYDPVP